MLSLFTAPFKITLLIALKSVRWLLLITFISTVYLAFTTVWSLIQTIINSLLSALEGGANSESCIWVNFAFLLDGLGITSAIVASLPLVFSAMSFFASVLLYRFAIGIKVNIENDIKDILNTLK